MWRNLKRRELLFDHRISNKDKIKSMIEGVGIIMLLSLFFYRSLWAVLFLSPLFFLYIKEKNKSLVRKRRREIKEQFKDAILSVSANQKAGYSVENSFRQAYGDMVLLYGKDSPICEELHNIVIGLGNNIILEKLLYDFAKRSRTEDVLEFAQVFAAAKRSGGNMTQIIEKSVTVIEEKAEVEKEIQILLAAKQMEQKIMNVVPFGILLYIHVTSKGYFDVLYHNLPGIIIMTICLGVYIMAVLLSRKVVHIEV